MNFIQQTLVKYFWNVAYAKEVLDDKNKKFYILRIVHFQLSSYGLYIFNWQKI